MDPQSAVIKRRGCVYSGICLFPPFPPARNPDAAEIFILFFDDDLSRPEDLYTFGFRSKGRAHQKKIGIKDIERKKERKGGAGRRERGRRRSSKNHDAIIFVPARERILRSSSPDRWTEEREGRRSASKD